MSRDVTIRFRATAPQKDELEELREWVGAKTLTALVWQAFEALKEESGFNLRNVEPLSIADGTAAVAQQERNKALTQIAQHTNAGAGHALPAFVPGIVATEGDT